MRNFEERKAEIFRRSDKRIKVRRRRMTALLSLPLLIGVMAISAGLYSDRFTKKSANEAEVGVVDSLTISEASTVSVEVKSDGDELNLLLEDEATVVEIMNIIHEVTNVNMETVAGNSSALKKSDEMSYTQQSSQKIYTIILTGEDGNKTTYLLYEEKIIDTEENREYKLSKEQLTILKELLCIPEE